jgi:hypothetical protein
MAIFTKASIYLVEYMNKMFGDMEDTLVLSSDGTSAEILEHALLYPSPRQAVF